MTRAKFLLGFLWASPITLLAFLLYVGPCWLLGWYRLQGWNQIAWVWETNEKSAPKWLKKRWSRWAGATVGNMIVMKPFASDSSHYRIILAHELVHVRQIMVLGILQPLCYAMNWFCGTILKKTMGHVDGYYDNQMEIQARRMAGQIVDIIGLASKLRESKKLK